VTRDTTALTIHWISQDTAQTLKMGAQLGRMLGPGDIVCLQGELGAGKTCLAKGIGQGLGIAVPIRSPTFILVREYPVAGQAERLFHIDMYRIESLHEARAIGIEDHIYGAGICVIEWAERLTDLLPTNNLWIAMRYVDSTRRELTLRASGSYYVDLLTRLQGELQSEGGTPSHAAGH
jgi:tRNA threonylcarbamoyladenosine biosynthesis protein TsaE